MKAISLWQPWASLWISPAKIHETRHWPTHHRGPLVVHAAKKLVSDCGELLDEICLERFGPYWRKELPRGALIGIVHLVSCQRVEELPPTPCPVPKADKDDWICGDFSDHRFAWKRGHFRVFDNPIPYVGRQGFFDVPDEIIPRIAA